RAELAGSPCSNEKLHCIICTVSAVEASFFSDSIAFSGSKMWVRCASSVHRREAARYAIFCRERQRPVVHIQAGGCAVKNKVLTDSRESATIVNTPRIVPKGMKRHSIQATTSAKE